MPGFDGTGPKGEGPFSGRGEGYCAVKLPDEPGQPVEGYVGQEGHPVGPGVPPRVPAHPPPFWRRWWPAPGWPQSPLPATARSRRVPRPTEPWRDTLGVPGHPTNLIARRSWGTGMPIDRRAD
jgi:hypothetical protein